MNLTDLLDEFNVVIDTAEGLTELRSLILGLAVRGKLVPQDSNDESASELLKKIEAEKERLYKEGEIRKPKNLPIVDENELYSVPENWKWVNLIDIGYWATGTGFPKKYQGEDNQEILFCKVSDMNLPGNELFIEETINTISRETASKLSANIHSKGTIIFPKIGGAIATNKRRLVKHPTIIDNNCLGITPYINNNIDWLFLLLKNIDLTEYQSGSSVPALAQGNLEEIPIPLPPLAEQHRIVQRIESLFAEVDGLEEKLNRQTKLDEKLQLAVNAEVQQAPDAEASKSAWNFITSNFDTLYHTPEAINNLKKNILNEAVRGRLVPQNPKDEPASELLKKIEGEKQRLYEEGEIRKPKKIKPVTKEDEPFEIPKEWKWCRLGNICDFITSGSTPKKYKFVDEGIPFLKVYNIRDQKIDFDYKPQFIKEDVHNGRLDRSKLYPGNVIMNIVGPPLGKIAIIPNTYPEWNCNQAIVVFRPFIEAINSYLYQFLRAQTFLTGIDLIGTAGQDNISVTKSNNIAFPLPPLEEQHRIVRRIEELFAICDRFKAQLEQRKAVNERLVKGLVGEVLEGGLRQADKI